MKKIKIGILLMISLISFCCFNDNVYATQYTCTYKGQLSGTTIRITHNVFGTTENWDVTYPNGTHETITKDNIGGNVFPTENCEDIFYSTEKNSTEKKVIKRVDAGTSYTDVYVSQYCGTYDDLEHFCSGNNCKIKNVSCGNEDEISDLYGTCPKEIAPIILFLKKVVMNTLQIFVPIILIIMATIDLVKAVMATDEKSMQEAIPKIIRRILAAVLMFFVTTIVVIVLDMFATSGVGEYNDWKACWLNLE